VFGFGGIPSHLGATKVSHCFNLNGQTDPVIRGLVNVYNSYKVGIVNTKLAGPTYFQHILKSLLEYVQRCMAFKMYHVMIILTDGEFHDRQDTIDLIVELSKYPVSIIIIGVGSGDDFASMEELDGDKKALRNRNGTPAVRDIVQFVKFHDYVNEHGANVIRLSEEVLKELPDQIV
jgi:Copine